MLFSSLVFIWYFLPIVFAGACLIPGLKGKNLWLLTASIFFYAWGEPKYVVLMLFSIAVNYGFGLWMDACREKSGRRLLLTLCILVNLGLLGYFKYFNFLAETVNSILGRQAVANRSIALPVGISFYTFQALSYVVDVYRGQTSAQKNPVNLALYIAFFPQLIAGPIVKYHDISLQLSSRTLSLDGVACGIKRFTYGLGKKVILSNAFAAVVDDVFTGTTLALASRELVWFTMILYALQIYYDFSGYSDMAIGLGKMFGFDFMENFRYPYLSQSVREFWRRWHISLSTWFREYLYIPLGGNRKGAARTYVNLFIVFLATGLWHGAGMNFLWWGIYYGFFSVAERLFLGNLLEKSPIKILNHLYAMLAVLFGWVLFRAQDMTQAGLIFQKMIFGRDGFYKISMFADCRIWFLLLAGLLLCGPVQHIFRPLTEHLYEEHAIAWYDVIIMALILTACTVLLVNSTYNPFIYFRF